VSRPVVDIGGGVVVVVVILKRKRLDNWGMRGGDIRKREETREKRKKGEREGREG
jgi:N-methylhydantoinase B/oxoprolinase/acetone carboxylase alpha subunit